MESIRTIAKIEAIEDVKKRPMENILAGNKTNVGKILLDAQFFTSMRYKTLF